MAFRALGILLCWIALAVCPDSRAGGSAASGSEHGEATSHRPAPTSDWVGSIGLRPGLGRLRERLAEWRHLDADTIADIWGALRSLQEEGDGAHLYSAWVFLNLLHLERADAKILEQTGAELASWLGLPEGRPAELLALAFDARKLALQNPLQLAIRVQEQKLGEKKDQLNRALRDEYARLQTRFSKYWTFYRKVGLGRDDSLFRWLKLREQLSSAERHRQQGEDELAAKETDEGMRHAIQMWYGVRRGQRAGAYELLKELRQNDSHDSSLAFLADVGRLMEGSDEEQATEHQPSGFAATQESFERLKEAEAARARRFRKWVSQAVEAVDEEDPNSGFRVKDKKALRQLRAAYRKAVPWALQHEDLKLAYALGTPDSDNEFLQFTVRPLPGGPAMTSVPGLAFDGKEFNGARVEVANNREGLRRLAKWLNQGDLADRLSILPVSPDEDSEALPKLAIDGNRKDDGKKMAKAETSHDDDGTNPPPPASVVTPPRLPPRVTPPPPAAHLAVTPPPPAASTRPNLVGPMTPPVDPTAAIIARAVALYCAQPYEATCENALGTSTKALTRVVDNGPIDSTFLEDVKRALADAIRNDSNPNADQKRTLLGRIARVRLRIGNDPSFCEPGRPSAMARQDLGIIYVCQGMIDKAVGIGKKEGKGPRSYMFHIFAHELGHYLVGTTMGLAGIVKAIRSFTPLLNEAIPDYYADRAMKYWKNWGDAVTLMNAARDGLRVLCTMSERNDHPNHRLRAKMIRWLDAGQMICSAQNLAANSNAVPSDAAVGATRSAAVTSPPAAVAVAATPPAEAVQPAAGPAVRPTPVNMVNYSTVGLQGFCVATPIAKKPLEGNRNSGVCDITYLSAAHCFYFPQSRSFARTKVTLGSRTYPIAQTKLEMSDEFRQNPFSMTPGERDAALLHVRDQCNVVPDGMLARLARPASNGVAPIKVGERLLAGNRDGSLLRGVVLREPVGPSRALGFRVEAGQAKNGVSGSPIWNSKNEIVGVVSTGTGPEGIGHLVGFSAKVLPWAWEKLGSRTAYYSSYR